MSIRTQRTVFVIVGIVLVVYLGGLQDAIGFWYWLVLDAINVFFLLYGGYLWAKVKGRHWAWMFTMCLWPLGLLILWRLKDRSRVKMREIDIEELTIKSRGRPFSQYKEGQLTFIDFLGYKPVMALAKRNLFGKPYLTLNDYFAVLASVYESAAVLGRARQDKLSILERMIETPWLEPEPMKSLQEEAKERLDTFREEMGREPHSFLEFIQVKQLENVIPDERLKRLPSTIYDMRQKGTTGERGIGANRELERLQSEIKKVVKKLDMKTSLVGAEPGIRVFGTEGVGFGSSFPQLTERMYRNLHENIDMLGLPVARAHGLAIPEKAIISLEEAEEEFLKIVSVYTLRYWPEMLDPLDLRGHLEMVKEEDR